MRARLRSPFTTLRTEGALLPADLLQRVLAGDADLDGLTPESYHLSGEKLNEAINRSWNRLQSVCAARLGCRGYGTGWSRSCRGMCWGLTCIYRAGRLTQSREGAKKP